MIIKKTENVKLTIDGEEVEIPEGTQISIELASGGKQTSATPSDSTAPSAPTKNSR